MNRKNHYLLTYLERHNASRAFNDKDPISLDQCKEESIYMELFYGLNSQLSPENLCCDGELRGRALATKRKLLNGAWMDLEKIAGVQFEDDDARIYTYQEKRLDEHECPECRYTAHRKNIEVPVPWMGDVTFNCPNCGDFKIKASDLRRE